MIATERDLSILVHRTEKLGPLSCLTGEALCQMQRSRIIRHYRRGQIVFYQGDELTQIFIVHSGLIKLVRTDRYNHELVIRLVAPGEAGGWRPILAGENAALTAEAVTPCTLALYPAASFLRAVEDSDALKMLLLKQLARELRDSEDRWFRSLNDSLEDRVLTVLSELSSPSHAVRLNGAVRITVPRTEIAAAVGINASTLSRILARFAQRGMLQLHARAIDLYNFKDN